VVGAIGLWRSPPPRVGLAAVCHDPYCGDYFVAIILAIGSVAGSSGWIQWPDRHSGDTCAILAALRSRQITKITLNHARSRLETRSNCASYASCLEPMGDRPAPHPQSPSLLNPQPPNPRLPKLGLPNPSPIQRSLPIVCVRDRPDLLPLGTAGPSGRWG
jgi:hypothetical protein